MGRNAIPLALTTVALLAACDKAEPPPAPPEVASSERASPELVSPESAPDDSSDASARERRTAEYIEQLDLDAIEWRGILGGPAPGADVSAEARDEAAAIAVEQAMERAAGVDRRAVFAHVFRELTEGAPTSAGDQPIVAVARFLQRAGLRHDVPRPRRADGLQIDDPLVALDVGWVRDRGGARLAADILEAGGYATRVIEIEGAGTVGIEVFHDDAWRAIDLTVGGGSQVLPRRADGSVPSWQELAADPRPLDALPAGLLPRSSGNPEIDAQPVRSTACFPPGAQVTIRTKEGEPNAADRNYGWLRTERAVQDWTCAGVPPRTLPGAVRWKHVRVSPARDGAGWDVRLRWHPARDGDGDVVGYAVFVGTESRGWDYPQFRGARVARGYWPEPVAATINDAMFALPRDDIGRFDATATEITVHVDSDVPIYVTAMAIDEYHRGAGKVVYPMSNELRIAMHESGTPKTTDPKVVATPVESDS